MDRYPDDLFEQIRRLTARVDQLEAQLSQRPGVTKASQGWLLADMSIPTVPTGHVHIGSASGDFFVATAAGEVKRMPGVGAAVADPSYNLTNATTEYNSGQAQTVVDTLDSLFDAFLELKSSLEGAGFIEF